MPLNKLDNFLKNVEGRILYVSPSDLDASDAMSNQGNSQTTPFKTIQRALIEAARFSYVPGNNNDITEKTTILLMPGDHVVDNRPGFKIKQSSAGELQILDQSNNPLSDGVSRISLNLESNFDLNSEDNLLYKFNSVDGGVIVPRGTSIVGLDLRKTKIRPKYVPNPTDDTVPNSAIFRITGACYFWQFSIFDGKLTDKVYVDNLNFSAENFVKPTFSHHKLTVFEYADGVNKNENTSLTDLNMYYYKLSIAYGKATENRDISEKFPLSKEGFVSKRPEFEIVGAFAADPISITNIVSGDGSGGDMASITVTTATEHGLDVNTPIRIKGVGEPGYNVSTNVTSISATDPKKFTYTLASVDDELQVTNVNVSNATVVVETDTVNGASPYIFNISLRSVFGMNGMHADGSKATGFRSMVVAQFTGVSLQKDDRAFVKYNPTNRNYESITYNAINGDALASGSSSLNSNKIYHLDSDAIYRRGWETRHVKISNDSILQIVSVFAIGYGVHFEGQSGSDASITNSNSNFGQLALVCDGFKKDAFKKDDRAFITHIIPPRAITTPEENIDWISIDNTETADDTKLYLNGFTSEDIKPPSLTQGFRIGAKTDDLIFVNIGGVERSAKIMMVDFGGGITKSGVKESIVTGGSDNGLFTTSSPHLFETGEKVIIISDDGDLPENIDEKTVYFVIRKTNVSFKLASSLTNASNDSPISTFAGTNLRVLSRVTDKESGDIGHPVQFDSTKTKWYITVRSGATNTITSNLSSLTTNSDPSFVKRISDTRSLDEKIYKLRLAIPKEITNSKNPENGFVIQESSSTDVRTVTDFTKNDELTSEDFEFQRNPRFISTCTFNNTLKTVTIGLEKPHNLNVGDLVTIKNITDTSNSTGVGNSSYNRTTAVTKIVDGLTFEYSTGDKTIPVSATNNFNDKTSDSVKYPRYERTDLQSNVYIFRNNIISEFINDTSDGVYQVFALNASNNISEEFQNLKYSQNVVDVYPQLDRDNINENPPASKTFASRSPLGQVTTNDPLKSITRETTDKLITNLGIGLSIKSYNSTTGVVSFTTDHNIAGIMTGHLNGGSGYNVPGTFYNVKVFTNASTQNDSTWNGTLAKVVVSGNAVSSFEITNPGSGMLGKVGYFDNNIITGGTGAKIDNNNVESLKADNVGVSTDLVLQTTGIGVTSDSYFRIIGANGRREVSIAKTTGDIPPHVGQYGFLVGPAVLTSASTTNSLTTFTSTHPHGLVAGNRFQFNDSNNNNKGTFIVKSRTSSTVFTATTNIGSGAGFILKHGLSANDGSSGKGSENLSIRGAELFNKETAKLSANMDSSPSGTNFSSVSVDISTVGGIINTSNILKRFPYGSYILIDEEIMRIKKSTLDGNPGQILSVIRGVFGTVTSSHSSGALIKSINAFPIQFNRPSILRASGHTFEYLGYGPGNYSTALPQVQVKTISEREEFLSQSQERAGGAVVYTGMNNKGDFYIGNQKKSALTGEETSFDTPIPSVAGENPGRLSVVFDEVTVKERIVIEGGKSKTVLSEFDGPVTYNNEVQFKDVLKLKNTTESTSSSTGALLISGGVGFAKTSHFGDGASLKFGDDGDLEIVHPGAPGTFSVIRDSGSQLFIDAETLHIRRNVNTGDPSMAKFNGGGSVQLWFDMENHNVPKFETLGVGATVNGDMYAHNFIGNGSQLTGIDQTKLVDSNNATRVQATTGGADVTGKLKATVNSQTTPAIRAENNYGPGSVISKYVGSATNGDLSQLQIRYESDGGQNGGDGDYQIVNSGSNHKLTIYGATTAAGGFRFELNDIFKMDIRDTLVRIGDPNLTQNVGLQVTGDITAFASSDKRLKDNISPITKALEKVNSISGNTFTWKENDAGHEGDGIGVIAQEIEALGLPELVTTRSNGYKAVKYEKLVPLLIEAVKELSAKVDTLESMAHPKPTGKTQKRNEDRLDALENQINN